MFRAPLWLAAAVPGLALAWGLLAWAAARRRGVGAALGRGASLSRAGEEAAPGRRRAGLLRLAALAFLFLALAGPRWGVDLVESRVRARQVVVAVDVSLSMRAADVRPSRLERAKASLSLLLEQLKGDRVGVVAFAGDAMEVCPLTADVDAAKELLGALEVGAVPVPGTAIGDAIRVSAGMLSRYAGAKTVVLLTDGEDHGTDPVGAARSAAAEGVRLYAIGIGTPEGEPIPLEGGGYKKDKRGATVVSRLGEKQLSEAASATGGAYYRTSPGEDEISDIVSRVQAGDPSKGPAGTVARWRDRYAWPLALAFLLILLEMALPLLPSPRRAAGPAAVLVLVLLGAGAAPARALGDGLLRKANKAYGESKYEDALALYGQASGAKPSDPRPVYNAGNALYRLDRDSDAAGAFASVAAGRGTPAPLKAASLYNLGNALYRDGEYAAAAQAYRGALAADPRDADARRNLVVALNRAKHPPPPKPKQKPRDDQKKPPEPKGGQDKSGGGGQGGPNAPPRPQDQMTREDAERVMRAVAEREKAARANAAQAPAYGSRPKARPPSEEDW